MTNLLFKGALIFVECSHKFKKDLTHSKNENLLTVQHALHNSIIYFNEISALYKKGFNWLWPIGWNLRDEKVIIQNPPILNG